MGLIFHLKRFYLLKAFRYLEEARLCRRWCWLRNNSSLVTGMLLEIPSSTCQERVQLKSVPRSVGSERVGLKVIDSKAA
jgi:hypothetical protein